MFQTLRSIFNTPEPVDFKSVVQRGALLLDVRTPREHRSGSIKGSRNIPLQSLQREVQSLNKEQPVIVYCASGSRSSAAKRILDSHGFEEVYNGGGWHALDQHLR